MIKVPCYGCEKRQVGCHSFCEKYKTFRRNRNYHNAKRKEQSDATDVCIRMKADTSGKVRHYRNSEVVW